MKYTEILYFLGLKLFYILALYLLEDMHFHLHCYCLVIFRAHLKVDTAMLGNKNNVFCVKVFRIFYIILQRLSLPHNVLTSIFIGMN